MLPYIVADIGGTNARFGLVEELVLGRQPTVKNIQILPGTNFPTFEDALDHYIQSIDGCVPQAACIAIASPIEGDRIHMTHLPWAFSIQEVKKRFGFKMFDVMNDFNAVAMGVSVVTQNDIKQIKDGLVECKENKAIVGPGTGLGVSALTFCETANQWLPISGLGGHVNIPVANEFEIEILRAAQKELPHVSAELLISGTGLPHLYNAVSYVLGKAESDTGADTDTDTTKTASEITRLAFEEKNSTCVEVLSVFCSLLGSVAGNLALTFGARGGVYIAGGIVPRFLEFLSVSEFTNRFENKGVMSEYVKNIPVYVLTNPHNGLIGAAVSLANMIELTNHSSLGR